MKNIIEVNNVSKQFIIPHARAGSIKELFTHPIANTKRKTDETQDALKEISFTINEGEFFGIVGRNGSGKSTLLKVLAGVYLPTSGEVSVNGSLTPFIELGVGFNQDLSGRDNVFLNGALLGFSRKEMSTMYDDIVEFAELERFMDQKLKNYSSGMQVRLAFSIAIRSNSKILLIDEVLAVGDVNFQKKCYDYFKEIKKHNKTIVFVSHDRKAIEDYCDRVLYLKDGGIEKIGTVTDVMNTYDQNSLASLAENIGDTEDNANEKMNVFTRIKNTKILINGKEGDKAKYKDKISIFFTVHALEEINEEIIVGLTLKGVSSDTYAFAENSRINKTNIPKLQKNSEISVKFSFTNTLQNDSYTTNIAVANNQGAIFYNKIDLKNSLICVGNPNPFVTARIESTISIKKEANKVLCFVCSNENSKWVTVEPIDEELSKTWGLSEGERRIFNKREGVICPNCGCNLRAIALAKGIAKHYQSSGEKFSNFDEWIDYANRNGLSVAEINSCHQLHERLKSLNNLYYSEYVKGDGKKTDPRDEDIQSLSYKSNSFDLVLHSETLEHIPDPKTAINETIRVAKKSGVCIFTTPILWRRKTRSRATLLADGSVEYDEEKSYHGYGREDCLVWWEFGGDFIENNISLLYSEPRNHNYVFIAQNNQKDESIISQTLLKVAEKTAILLNYN